MPAALYKLAGKPHPAAAQTTETPAESSETVADVVSSIVKIEENTQEIVNQTITWDPNATKAQLLEIAAQLQIPVTSVNTKAQIIEALTLATSK